MRTMKRRRAAAPQGPDGGRSGGVSGGEEPPSVHIVHIDYHTFYLHAHNTWHGIDSHHAPRTHM